MSVTTLGKAEILALLSARGASQRALFARARAARREAFGERAFVRGVVEISSYCRKGCDYCGMRAGNRGLQRFRSTVDDVMEAARRIHELRIPTILIQGGEDVQSDRMLEEAIPRVKSELGLFIILNVGERKRDRLETFRRLGADSFIMKFETSDPELYERSTHSALSDRLQGIRWLQELGYKVGVGNIVGLPGQDIESIADDLRLASELAPDFVSASPFIPNEGTPWENAPFGCLDTTLNAIAISRLLMDEALIPSVSALEKVQAGGQTRGFEAGANVITINFTRPQHRESYRIYSKERFVVSHEHALRTLATAGLRPAESYPV